MRLHALVPSISAELVQALEDSGIKTDTDLLFSGALSDIFRRLPPGTLTLNELKQSIQMVAKAASAPALRADELLQNETLDDYELISGVPDLDQLLGNFGQSRVFEFSGPKESGKTALALQIVLRHLVKYAHSSACWIDTTGDFSVERCSEMLTSFHGEAASSALDRLQVSLAFDIEAVHDVLETIRATLSSTSPPQPCTRCIVIDPITLLLGPMLSNVSSQGHAIMTTFMRQLRVTARSYSLTIIAINDTSGSPSQIPYSAFSSTIRKPALGPSFTFLTDATVWMSKQNVSTETATVSTHVAEVFRSRLTRSKTWCTFQIRDGILVEA